MLVCSGLQGNFTGLAHVRHSNQHFHINRDKGIGSRSLIPYMILRARPLYLLSVNSGSDHVASFGNHRQLGSNGSVPEQPYLLRLSKRAIWKLRSVLTFLVEQPSQLKYIEWPSFQTTLKTAVLTLILVALLIVALSSVDSALYYMLALFLRRKA